MNRTLLFFAEINPDRITVAAREYLRSPWLSEVIIVSTAMLGAMLVAAAWAFFHWKKSRRTHLRRYDLPAEANVKSDRRGRRRRRRPSRSANPTLAQTGGLPRARRSGSETSPTL